MERKVSERKSDENKVHGHYLLVSVGGQLFSILLSFISRMFFIHYLSAEYLGLNGLFTDVLGILNLAELGIGTCHDFQPV